MAALVWVTVAMAIWHFTVFVPDRFRGGIVGAFLTAVAGGSISGAIGQIIAGTSIGDTSLLTVLWTIPGTLAALAIAYVVGARQEERLRAEAEAL